MKLELVKVYERNKINMGLNIITIKEAYEIGGYEVDHITKIYEDGSQYESFRIGVDIDQEYLPEITYEYDPGSSPEKRFLIMTKGYGELIPEEAEKMISGYQEAIEVVRILTEAFIMKGEKK